MNAYTITTCLNRSLNVLVVISRLPFSSGARKIQDLLKTMPKEPTHIADLQNQRRKIKEKSVRYSPGTVNLQFLAPSASGIASVYLFTDQSRYLFNCGEGVQRLAHEHKSKLARLEHIFMTRTNWDRIGGLPGLSLTVQESGVPNLTLHGPPGLDELFKAMRKFIVLKDLWVNAKQCENGGQYEDTVLTIDYVPLRKGRKAIDNDSLSSSSGNSEEEIVEDNIDYYEHETKDRRLFTSQWPPNPRERRNESVVMAYVCRLKPRPGQLNLERCVEHGVPPGPLLGKLKNGIDITLPNGVVVKSSDVRAPDEFGPGFVFIDIPSEDYLESLEQNLDKFAESQKRDSDVKAAVVVHFTPKSVLNHSIYQTFIHGFPEETVHLMANDLEGFSGFVASHRIQYQLNHMDSIVFPVLKESLECEVENVETLRKRFKSGNQVEMVKAEEKLLLQPVTTLTTFHLRPRKELDRSQEPTLAKDDYIAEFQNVEGFQEVLKTLKKEFPAIDEDGRNSKFPRIVFLGTGSCIPNKTRNVSAILLHTSPTCSILLDCGEGTAGQIYRFYGRKRAAEVFRNLKAIYISHLHADHHIGLIGILRECRNQSRETRLLFAPRQIDAWLQFYDRRIEPIAANYRLIPNGELINQPFDEPGLEGLETISTCLVRHCPNSFGVAISLAGGVKVTYSGDTMPCSELIDLGRDSTVLIHEATMEDELEAEAEIKMHSTTSQAIRQGVEMKAEYILLTHFSQRYAKIPRIEDSLMQKNVGVAFDNMEVTLDDLPRLHKFYSCLKLMFAEYCEEMNDRALKRLYKKQRAETTKE